MTHLAGGAFQYNHYSIQRCAICGKALVKYDLRTLAVPVGSKNDGPGYWRVGSLVERDGNRTSLIGELAPDFKAEDLPPDFCLWDLNLESDE